MSEKQEMREVTVDKLVSTVKNFSTQGYRLVQISCTKLNENLEINYSFDKDYEFVYLKLNVPMNAELPSVSEVYWSAMLYENEIHDLFGLKINGMAIDFKGNLYKTTVKTPFGSC
ncbi:NADH-quinone oxidoreductase subunit C [Acetivibrio cellulolyticus]|uniref:NADH-quinone oxidoreductase subunit C n=1 Tax=Acetivibrio cellulolyticus TaxID=35830 RepID=UPI0001E3018F|nr:NADH-quinone oxidoreductase subunit C [Acetivibrio cellulolyticus]